MCNIMILQPRFLHTFNIYKKTYVRNFGCHRDVSSLFNGVSVKRLELEPASESLTVTGAGPGCQPE